MRTKIPRARGGLGWTLLVLITASACGIGEVRLGGSPTPGSLPQLVLGQANCSPVSPQVALPNMPDDPLGALRGTSADGAEIHARFGPSVAGAQKKILWRMTGRGPIKVFAESADGTRIEPDLVEMHLGSSNFNAPGDEWGLFFTFPRAGCWRIHAVRDDASGSVWFLVG